MLNDYIWCGQHGWLVKLLSFAEQSVCCFKKNYFLASPHMFLIQFLILWIKYEYEKMLANKGNGQQTYSFTLFSLQTPPPTPLRPSHPFLFPLSPFLYGFLKILGIFSDVLRKFYEIWKNFHNDVASPHFQNAQIIKGNVCSRKQIRIYDGLQSVNMWYF